MDTSPVPIVLDDESRKRFPAHRHRQGIMGRAQCPARCRCGRICAWHYEVNGFVGACADPTKDCDQFADAPCQTPMSEATRQTGE